MTLPGPGGDEPRDEDRPSEQLRAAEDKLAGAQRELEAARAVGSALALAVTCVDDNLRPAVQWDLVRRLSRKALAHLETSDSSPAESAPIEFFIGFKQKDGSYRYAVADEPDFNLNGYVNATTLKYHDGSGPAQGAQPITQDVLTAARRMADWIQLMVSDGFQNLTVSSADAAMLKAAAAAVFYKGHLAKAESAKVTPTEEDFPPFGVDPGDSAALFKLRSAIDDADLWPSQSIQEAGDYEASVAFMARVARPALLKASNQQPPPPAEGARCKTCGRLDCEGTHMVDQASYNKGAYDATHGQLDYDCGYPNCDRCKSAKVAESAGRTAVPLTAELLVEVLDEVGGGTGYGGPGHYILRLLADKLRERAGLPLPDLFT